MKKENDSDSLYSSLTESNVITKPEDHEAAEKYLKEFHRKYPHYCGIARFGPDAARIEKENKDYVDFAKKERNRRSTWGKRQLVPAEFQ